MTSCWYREFTNGNQFSKRSKPFAVWQQNDDFVIVVPPGTEEEIKNMGPDKLSFLHAVNDVG
jgi:hypothetical protein